MSLQTRHFRLPLESIALAAGAVSLGVLAALLVDSGRVDLTLITLLVIAGALALSRPGISLIMVTATALLIVGFVQLYLPELQKIRWGVAIAAGLLGTVVTLRFLFRPERKTSLPPNAGVLSVFLLLVISSAVINNQSLAQFTFGFKGYVQVVGIFFATAMLADQNRTLDFLPRLLVGIAILQLPFVIQQWLVLVPQRVSLGDGVVAEDVVAGTMGATITGGGANAVLSILLITAIAIVASGYQLGQIRARRAVIGCLICALPIFLNANRVAALYLLIVFFFIFAPTMLRNTSRFLAGAIITSLFVVGSVWTNLEFGSRSEEYTDWRDLVHSTLERNTARDIGYGELELNRLSSITFWWDEQFTRGNASKVLFGHGPGAAREAGGSALPVETLASSTFPGVGIGLTGISSILWELGVVGLAVVIWLLFNAFRSARFLRRQQSIGQFRQFVARGLQVSVIIFAMSLAHKNTLVFHLTYQALFYLILGVLSAWHHDARFPTKSEKTIEPSMPDPVVESAAKNL